jgi:ribonuclease HII
MEAVAPAGLICGVDEAGRGPLCGAVVAAAVVLDPMRPIDGLNDSKKLTAAARERLALLIRERALAWSVAEASVQEIDQLNILQATMLAMTRAVESLPLLPDLVRIDGNRCPPLKVPCEAVIQGDARVPAIAAASILAKTVRDAQMVALDACHPAYGFAQHKGYATVAHLAALRAHGVIDCYRRSFAPVRQMVDNPELWPAGEWL